MQPLQTFLKRRGVLRSLVLAFSQKALIPDHFLSHIFTLQSTDRTYLLRLVNSRAGEQSCSVTPSFLLFAWVCHAMEASIMHGAQEGFSVLQLILPLVMLQITLPVSMFPFKSSPLCDTRDTYSHG